MKIVYCLDELEAVGGIERVTIAKANALSQVPGNEVYLIVAYDRKEPALAVDPAIRIVSLGVRYYDDKQQSRLGRLLYMRKLRKEHCAKMQKYLDSINPDIVLSTGMSEKHFLGKMQLSVNPVRIREFHFHKYYRRTLAIGLYETMLARLSEFVDYHSSVSGFDRIVLLTEQDKNENWKGWDNVEVIPNPLIALPEEVSALDNKVVIAAGRLVNQKNFSSLISAWKVVAARHPDWELRIFGDGPMHQALEAQIAGNDLSDCVMLCGFSDNIQKEMCDASIYVLSSICEGFGMVIIEAMACGLPVISYDCPCGPKDLIEDGVDGFLVPLNDEKQLADKMVALIEDETMRGRIGKAASETSKKYLPEKITEQWMSLFRSLSK